MKQPTPVKQRLRPQDWIDAGIKLLAEAGIGAVSIDRLAASLDVTRGSFYYHFSDRQALLQVMLEYWAQRWTYDVREQIVVLELDPSTTLLALMRAIRSHKAAHYDAPIRSWALHDPVAQAVVEKVDNARLEFILSQFKALGFKGLDAENRARLYLYYQVAEPMMLMQPCKELDEQLLVQRHRFLTMADVEVPSPDVKLRSK